MTTFNQHSKHAYVIKLVPRTTAAAGELRGRIEHLLSGRRHDFDTSQALIDCLLHEEQQVGREQGQVAIGTPRAEGIA
ncbi:MAG: hypothetical protein HZC37_01095 [Burkholderiales bacterium]|nr:hypothetical protein [Burkholderiales bacterium]